MNTEYIHALADALVAQGRRYGLSNNTRAHLIQILSSVPVPCCKESCDKSADATVRVSAPGVPVAEPQGATTIPAALPSDEKIAAAVQATADKVVLSPTPTVPVSPSLPVPDDFSAASESEPVEDEKA